MCVCFTETSSSNIWARINNETCNESDKNIPDDDVSVTTDDEYDISTVDEDDKSTFDEFRKDEEFREKFRKWGLENNITHIALRGVIQIINERFGKLMFPKDPRTILKTPRNVEITTIGIDQHYWHKMVYEIVFKCVESISLNINMDGLPIHKSSKDELWPILFNIAEMPRVKPMVIGIFHGKSKASNLEGYLQQMVNELKPMMENGIFINGHKITVKLRCFICDSLARAFIKGKE